MLTKSLTDQQLLAACSLARWQSQFEKITVPTVSLPIPSDVLRYLRADFFILPAECGAGNSEPDYTFGETVANESQFAAEAAAAAAADSDSDESDADESREAPHFPVFSARLQQAIANFGGGVFVKTNWHSPKDAFWINAGQTLRCRDISDVYQLLKASSFCKLDVGADGAAEAVAGCPDDEQFLHVRRWMEIHPGSEFRCYVRDRRLIAITPRDWPQYHAYIPAQRRDIVNDVRTMFVEHIKERFALKDYCFDVVRDQKDNVWLMDFSPYGPKWTDDALAFDWAELDALHEARSASVATANGDSQSDSEGNRDTEDTPSNELVYEDELEDEDDPEFRYVSADTGIQPSKRNNYGIPRDVIDVYSRTGVASPEAAPADTCTLDDLLFRQLRGLSDREGEH